ncbi:hypothetical protein MASR2M117_16530 [Paludibacter sp.]
MLFLFLGTIGTQKGFHFPELTYTFIVIPVAFSFFSFSKTLLLKIARIFFRIMLLFLVTGIVYWWYNFLCLDVSFVEWISNKLHFEVNMIGWEEQFRLSHGNNYSAYFFVNSWAYYAHPSYISLVLFFGLIVGFNLFYKNDNTNKVSIVDVTVYILLSTLMIALMQSRIGIVGLVLICAISLLYFIKLKTKWFKIILPLFLIVGVGALAFVNYKFSGLIKDEIRNTLNTLAISYFKNHVWWGTGTQEQFIALRSQLEIMKNDVYPLGFEPIFTHNQFLGNMVQYGIWGFILLSSILIVFANYAIKHRSYLMQMFLFIIIIFMQIEEPLYIQEGITRFTVFLTFFVAVIESNHEKELIDISQFRLFKNTQ